MRNLLTSLMLMLCTALFAQNLNTIITEQPEGTLYEGYGTAKGLTEFYYNLIPYELDGIASKYVVTDNDEVYLYNPVSNYNAKSWLKGTLNKETGEVTFTLPQLINSEVANDGEGEYLDYIVLCKMIYSEDAKTYVASPGDQELKFQLDNGVLTMLDDQFIGIANMNGEWYGIGESEKNICSMTDNVVKPANEDGAVACLMKYQSKDNEDSSRPVFVKVEDSDIYIKGLAKNNPEAWIKGNIQGNKATFPSKQYLGVNEENVAHNYFMVIDESKNQKSSVTFEYNAEPLTLTTNAVISTNFGKNNVMTFDYYKAPVINAGENVVAVAPTIKDCTPEDAEYSWFTITLSAKTKDGKDLDAEKLYYNIYFDDQPFTFTTSPYSTFDKDMTDIPYGFDDGNYYITKQGNDRIIYIYKKDFQKLSIQSFYLDGESKLFSDMAVWPEQEQPKAEAPVAPVIKNCTPVDGEYSWFTITLSAKTKDGKDLDAEKLYYNIYFDDQPFTFTTSPYSTFDKDMTDIPYGFDDGNYYITKQGDDRIVYIYKKDFAKLGVECFYLDSDNKLVTERAEWNAPTDGIEEITSNDSRNTTWKDLSGRSVKNPSNGIFFRVMKKADGSTKVIKQVVK